MLRSVSKPPKYHFNKNSHYIITDQVLTAEELQQLGQLLESFPHAGRTDEWPDKFAKLNLDAFPAKLVHLAANAYDRFGNTVLGVAAEYGKSVEAVQQLIDIGADLDTPDLNMNKLAIHWAINNKLSCHNQKSYDVIKVLKCLLDNGAKADIRCYQKSTPLEYAKKRGFKAATNMLEEHQKTPPSLYKLCFFKLKDMINNDVINKNAILNAFPSDCVPENLDKLIRYAHYKRAFSK